ncbi:MAG: zinc dependent phospholipase C family protein [Candidatus Ozemobacteraceae bacterium]
MDGRQEWMEMIRKGKSEKEIDAFLQGVRPLPPPLPLTTPGRIYKPSLFTGGPGFLGCFTWLNGVSQGHFEATNQALKEVNCGLKESAITSIARASRLPDLIFFSLLEYHAMTPCENQNPKSKSKGKKDFIKLFHTTVSEAQKAFGKQKNADAFFQLGIFFHLVQDLITHNGMTNPEHAYFDQTEQSPDKNPRNFELAKEMSVELFNTHFRSQIIPISDNLNSHPEMSWGEYESVTNYLSSLVAGVDYKLSALDSNDAKHVVRWLTLNENQTLDQVKLQIRQLLHA